MNKEFIDNNDNNFSFQINRDIYNRNIEFLYIKTLEYAEVIFDKLVNETSTYINTFCLNSNDKNQYYLEKFNEVKGYIQNNTISNFNIQNLFNVNFENEKVIIDKNSFEMFASLYLNIPRKVLIKDLLDIKKNDIEDPGFEEMQKQFIQIMEQIKKVFEIVKMENAEKITTYSIALYYFKHLLNEQKEIESDNLKVKGLKSFDLYQRYLILDETLNITADIHTSQIRDMNGKHKLLAILLNCDIDNAKHLLNGTYSNKIKNVKDKEFEVKDFIKNLINKK